MKICVMGTGSQGAGLAGLLAMEPDVEKLIIADYSKQALDSATELIGTLGDRIRVKDISSAQVDAGNEDEVAQVIAGCDIVFNGIIPKYNIPIMKACIRERCHYLDLFASPYEGPGLPKSETIGAQFDLSEEFKKAGITALPSIGMSPGWTSLAAQHAIDRLDEVNDVIIRWGDFIDTDEFFAPISPIVIFHEWFGAPYPVCTEDGKQKAVDLVSSEEDFEFPEPIGTRTIYTVTSHPDIVLIPQFAGKPVHRCEEKGGIFLGGLSMKDVWFKAIQKATSAQGDATGNVNMMQEFANQFTLPNEYGRLLKEKKIKEHAVCFSCEVNGYQNGNYIRHIQYYTSLLEDSLKHLPWASPAVYGTVGGMPIELVLALGRGEINKPGVFSIGELGISDQLNRAMARRGQILTEKIICPSGLSYSGKREIQ